MVKQFFLNLFGSIKDFYNAIDATVIGWTKKNPGMPWHFSGALILSLIVSPWGTIAALAVPMTVQIIVELSQHYLTVRLKTVRDAIEDTVAAGVGIFIAQGLLMWLKGFFNAAG
jgi:hypothetical protein